MSAISADCLREILDESCEAIYVTDAEYTVLYANKAARAMGKRLFHVEVTGKKCYQCLIGRETPCPFCKMKEMTRERYLVRNFSGATGRVFELRGKLIDWQGTPAHIEYIRNITDLDLAEKRSEELAAQQKSLYEHIGIGMCLYLKKDDGLQALVCNDAYRQIFCLSKKFDSGEPIQLELRNFSEKDRTLLKTLIPMHIREEKPFHRVCQIIDQETGLPRSVLMNMECVPKGEQGTLWYVSAYDVSEWVEWENQLNHVLNNISGGIARYQISKAGRVRTLMFTDGLSSMQGYTRQEYETLVERDALDSVCPEDRDRLERELKKSVRDQAAFSAVYRVHHKEKGSIWVNLAATPAGVDAEGCIRYNALLTNASRQFELYRQMLDNSENGLIVSDRETREIYFSNCAAQRMMALAEREDGHGGDSLLGGDACLTPQQDGQPRKVTVAGRTYQVYTHFMEWMDRLAVAQYFSDITGETQLQERMALEYEDLKIRYDYEMTRLDSFEDGIVERMLLDLTEDKVVRAANPHSASLTRLIGMSIGDLLTSRLTHTEDETGRAQLRCFMDREALLQAYYTGEHPALEMMSPIPGTGEEKYFLSTAQLAKNPGNGHIIAFVETRDNDLAVTESTLMRRLLETNYESAVVVHASTGRVKIGVKARETGFITDIALRYDELAERDILRWILPEEREQVSAQISLAAIREKLKDAAQCSGRVALRKDDTLVYKMWAAVYFDKKQSYILVTVADVTEVYERDLQTAQQLKDALERAEVASQSKSTFLARMSHEIRTPITTVSGVLELIRMACQRNDIRTEELLRQIDTADAANQYLLTLINDLLDISKIEKDELTLKPVPTDIRQMIGPMCAMLKPSAEKKHIRLELQRKTNTSDWYMMDATRVQQILMNLLSNAIKFTPEGGTVRFTGEVTQAGGGAVTLQFVVSDTGVGISEAFKADVFEPFKQEYASNSGYGGTGIGLAISRSLARMMGGDITFQSEKGKGSVFTATMRLELAREQDRAEPQPAEAEKPMLDGLNILLCEDNQINQEIVRQLLESGGCAVTAADNGQQALERFTASAPGIYDLILMDIRMPVMDGLEAARRIRALDRPDAGTVPIVAMSANAYEEDRQMSLAAGMNEHLSKPVETKLLYQTIYRYCRGDNSARRKKGETQDGKRDGTAVQLCK